METLEPLRRKIESAGDLHGVVKTMKALAAVSIRQYEKAVESLGSYNRAVEMGFQVLLRQRPPGTAVVEPVASNTLGAIVFGSDQGMVGQFNDVIANVALDGLEKLQPGLENTRVLAVGMRAASRLQEAGLVVEDVIPVPGAVGSVAPVVQDLVLRLEQWRIERDMGRIVLFYNRPLSGAAYEPHSLQLLPVDMEWFERLEQTAWPCRSLPSFTMNWNQLFSSLIQEYLFVSLYRAFAESLASENASRLASMQAAERNIEDRLEVLNAQFHQLRQSAIDAELFDLVAGFEALTGDHP